MNTTVELIQLACGLCGELVSRQIRAHALDVSIQHPCTNNRMRNVITEYVRGPQGWQTKGNPTAQ